MPNRPSPRLAATNVLKEHLVDDEGMLNLPVDPFTLAEKLGIRVSFSSHLGDGVGGIIVKEAGDAKPQIFLSSSDPSNRQRFTAAHELGHYFSRSGSDQEKYGYIDSRADLSSRGTDGNERWANSFGAELLMPAFAVRKFFSEGMSEQRLAREFAVSEQAMHFRLINLGLA